MDRHHVPFFFPPALQKPEAIHITSCITRIFPTTPPILRIWVIIVNDFQLQTFLQLFSPIKNFSESFQRAYPSHKHRKEVDDG